MERPSFARRPRRHPQIVYKGRIKLKVQGRDSISVGQETVDLRYVEQLVDSGQLHALGYMMKYLEEGGFDGTHTIRTLVDAVYAGVEKRGFGALFTGRASAGDVPGNLMLPRRQELFACINRYRMHLK